MMPILGWLSVWCRQYSQDFGHVMFPMESGSGSTNETLVGELENTKHSVRGKVYRSNSNDAILIIKEFYYDGK